MIKIWCIAFLLIVSSQVRGDEVDDLLEEYQGQLDALATVTDGNISDAETNLDETDLYMKHAAEVFTQSGLDEITLQQASVNGTAEELTLTAITNNKPASVLTCINKERETGLGKLADLATPFTNKLNTIYSSSSSGFTSQRSTIELIDSQLQTLYESNSEKLKTCVVEACFESNISAAAKQYANLDTNLADIIANVKSARSKFNDDVIEQLNNLRTDAQSAVDTAVKKMGKC